MESEIQNPVRAVIIGGGAMGQRHAHAIAALNGYELVGICDTDTRILSKLRDEFPCRIVSNIKQLLLLQPDAAIIAVPVTQHLPVALSVLQEQLHVLVEKPIAASIEEGKLMIDAARNTRRTLMIGHVERFNPVISHIQGILRPEEIISISLSRVGPPAPGSNKTIGALLDLAVHDFDLVKFITKREIVELFAVASPKPPYVEETATILMSLEGNVTARIEVSRIATRRSRLVRICTKDRTIEGNLIDRTIREYLRCENSFTARECEVTGEEPLRRELMEFNHALSSRRKPSVSPEDCLAALQLAVLAQESSMRGRSVSVGCRIGDSACVHLSR